MSFTSNLEHSGIVRWKMRILIFPLSSEKVIENFCVQAVKKSFVCVFLFLFCFIQNRFLFSRGIVSLFYGSVLASDKLTENGLWCFFYQIMMIKLQLGNRY